MREFEFPLVGGRTLSVGPDIPVWPARQECLAPQMQPLQPGIDGEPPSRRFVWNIGVLKAPLAEFFHEEVLA